jgi:signal-transduction protein with cAMP-binding, CBS, and nucleotidyltransferase domain
MERVIEQEIETLRTLANELEKDFSVLLLKGVDKDEIQKIKTRIKKHIVSLQMIITDLKTDLDFIGEWRKND